MADDPGGPLEAGGRSALRAVRNLGVAGAVTAGVIAIGLALFGPGAELEPAAAQATVAAASLDVLELSVEWQSGGTSTYDLAQDNQVLAIGDSVRTDENGFAQVDWSDGSLVRLDADTELTIIDLAGEALAPTVTARLDVGRVWNRVQGVTGQHGAYEVETAVGTAAVRGTAFSIACTPEGNCTFVVWDGTVEVTTPDGGVVRVTAGETVVIAAAETVDDGVAIIPPGAPGPEGEPGPPPAAPDDPTPPPAFAFVEVSRESTTPAAQQAGDPWIEQNLTLDERTGRFGPRREACAATLAGRNARLADRPETAIELDASAAAPAVGLTTAALDGYEIRLALLGQEFTAARGTVTGRSTEFRSVVQVADHAVFGVGLYEVAAVTTGVECRLDGFIRITGRHPLTTVAGLLALLLSVLGLALLLASVGSGRRGASAGRRRLYGAISGVVGGVGLAVLLQQYGAVMLTLPLLGAFAGTTATIGAALPRSGAIGD